MIETGDDNGRDQHELRLSPGMWATIRNHKDQEITSLL